MPDDLAEPVVTAACFFCRRRAMGCGQHPAFPAPSCIERDASDAQLGRNPAARMSTHVAACAVPKPRQKCHSCQRPGSSGETMSKAVLGIIGGSGIYDLPGLENAREEAVNTPWGEPSAPLRRGSIAGLPIVFLPRHDKGHRLSPSDINYRANIDVLKRAGVTDLVSLSACGSFKEELPPGTFVLVDQFVDRTHKRESSFFGRGCVAHV